MLAGIAALLTNLPEIIKLAREVFEYMKRLFGDDPQKFIKDLNNVFLQINQAETEDERKKAAFALHDLITKL